MKAAVYTYNKECATKGDVAIAVKKQWSLMKRLSNKQSTFAVTGYE
jgi:hypothetical protein